MAGRLQDELRHQLESRQYRLSSESLSRFRAGKETQVALKL